MQINCSYSSPDEQTGQPLKSLHVVGVLGPVSDNCKLITPWTIDIHLYIYIIYIYMLQTIVGTSHYWE